MLWDFQKKTIKENTKAHAKLWQEESWFSSNPGKSAWHIAYRVTESLVFDLAAEQKHNKGQASQCQK